MEEIPTDPKQDVVEELKSQWAKESDTFGRVFATILEITELTHYPKIAERADCSPNSAKKHLDRLASIGIVEREAEGIAVYRRDDSYLEWVVINRIADEQTLEEIIQRVGRLEEIRTDYVELFGVSNPAAVSIYDVDSDQDKQELMDAVGEWKSIEQKIYLHERARQLSSKRDSPEPRSQVTNVVPEVVDE